MLRKFLTVLLAILLIGTVTYACSPEKGFSSRNGDKNMPATDNFKPRHSMHEQFMDKNMGFSQDRTGFDPETTGTAMPEVEISAEVQEMGVTSADLFVRDGTVFGMVNYGNEQANKSQGGVLGRGHHGGGGENRGWRGGVEGEHRGWSGGEFGQGMPPHIEAAAAGTYTGTYDAENAMISYTDANNMDQILNIADLGWSAEDLADVNSISITVDETGMQTVTAMLNDGTMLTAELEASTAPKGWANGEGRGRHHRGDNGQGRRHRGQDGEEFGEGRPEHAGFPGEHRGWGNGRGVEFTGVNAEDIQSVVLNYNADTESLQFDVTMNDGTTSSFNLAQKPETF